MFWALRLSAQPAPVPPQAVPAQAQTGSAGAVARMLASPTQEQVAAAPPPESTRFRLIGLMAPREGRTGPGVALVSVDDRPARAYAIGSRVDGDITLQALARNSATFGREGGGSFTLELPPLPPPQTGQLPAFQPEGEPPQGGNSPGNEGATLR